MQSSGGCREDLLAGIRPADDGRFGFEKLLWGGVGSGTSAVGTERLLIEQLQYNLPVVGFVGLKHG